MATDPDSLTTYAAEDMVAAWIDDVDAGDGTVWARLVAGGSAHHVTFSPEPEPRFSRPGEVQPFVDAVLARLQNQARQFGSPYRGREAKPVVVQAHSGFAKASYRDGFLYLPQRERGGAWALRGLVVVHELAHHLNTGDGAIIDQHGDGFRTTMLQLLEDLGWVEIAAMLRAALREVGVGRRDDDGGMLAKIGKLMRHAEGASTEAERDAFFAKAQELATANSVELALARASLASGESAPEPTFEIVQLAHRGQQSAVRFVALMLAVARTNDLRCSIRSDNTSTTLYGFATDIEVAKSLYASLVIQMVSDADAYLRSGAHRPVHGRTARASFYAGWTQRIGERLAEARSATQLRLGAVTRTVDESTGTVSETRLPALIAKDVEIDDYAGHMMRQHGVRGSWRGGTPVGDLRSVLRGGRAADRARLRDSKEISA